MKTFHVTFIAQEPSEPMTYSVQAKGPVHAECRAWALFAKAYPIITRTRIWDVKEILEVPE